MKDAIHVRTKAGSYPVVIGEGLDVGKLVLGLKKPCKILLISDDTVFDLHGKAVCDSLMGSGFPIQVYLVPPGEQSKDTEILIRILRCSVGYGIERDGLVVALGGGVVGDLAGLVAALFRRGIDFIQMPTTILAAVDSSVGGKVGVDLPEGKNAVGAFHNPLAVFCDTNTFSTLPDEVRAAGMAEVIKHGMIADAQMLSDIRDMPIGEICRRNVATKAGIVEQDEFDRGIRGLLGFGHTIAHAIETAGYYSIPHGHAVAIGMKITTGACEKLGISPPGCLAELKKHLVHFGLPMTCGFSAKKLASVARRDNRRSGDKITLAVLKGIGQGGFHEMPVEELESFIAAGLDA